MSSPAVEKLDVRREGVGVHKNLDPPPTKTKQLFFP